MSERRADIDWLRVMAVLLVFAVHAAQVFSPIDDWHIRNAETSRLLGMFTVFMAPWLMPLFLLVAGQSAWFTLRKGETGRFLRARLFRLFVPLVAGTLLVVPPQVYLRRLSRGEFEGSYLAFYPRFFDGVFPQGNFSWGHLWFLAYLFAYTVVALPIFRFLLAERGRALLASLARILDWPGGILLLFIPLALGQILLRPHFPQSTGALVGDWSTHAWLFPVYILGFALMVEPRLESGIRKGWRTAFLPGVITSAGLFLFAWPGEVWDRMPTDPGVWQAIFWTGFMLASWSWLVFMAGAARAWLSRSNAFLRYWGDRIYPLYIFHQTVIVLVAYFVVQWTVGVPLKFGVVLTGSFAGTVVILEVAARVEPLRRLFGLGRRPREAGSPSPPRTPPA
jgi:glucans biosynthesis protein C